MSPNSKISQTLSHIIQNIIENIRSITTNRSITAHNCYALHMVTVHMTLHATCYHACQYPHLIVYVIRKILKKKGSRFGLMVYQGPIPFHYIWILQICLAGMGGSQAMPCHATQNQCLTSALSRSTSEGMEGQRPSTFNIWLKFDITNMFRLVYHSSRRVYIYVLIIVH